MSDIQTQRRLLDEFKLQELFIEHLGWDRHEATLQVPIDGHEYALAATAQKRGFAAYVCESGSDDRFRWHLDERPLRENNEINPDVLGYIFEKYINQKQMGA